MDVAAQRSISILLVSSADRKMRGTEPYSFGYRLVAWLYGILIAIHTKFCDVVCVIDFFDPDADFQICRRRLPHWRQARVTYFVTFRLMDSLPRQKLAALNEERKRWMAMNLPPYNQIQIKEYHRNFSRPIHAWLDAGDGACVLAQPEIHRLIESVLKFFQGQRYELGEFVVMPNHVRGLVRPFDSHRLDRILHSWKSFSSNHVNKIRNSHGPVWHRESFDHIVRNATQLARIESYIRDNPKSLPSSRDGSGDESRF
jgi:REP element-mobilizing transposase RayT